MTAPGSASMKPGTTDSEIDACPAAGWVTEASPSAATTVTLEEPSSVA
jgi:hypothetical protein